MRRTISIPAFLPSNETLVQLIQSALGVQDELQGESDCSDLEQFILDCRAELARRGAKYRLSANGTISLVPPLKPV